MHAHCRKWGKTWRYHDDKKPWYTGKSLPVLLTRCQRRNKDDETRWRTCGYVRSSAGSYEKYPQLRKRCRDDCGEQKTRSRRLGAPYRKKIIPAQYPMWPALTDLHWWPLPERLRSFTVFAIADEKNMGWMNGLLFPDRCRRNFHTGHCFWMIPSVLDLMRLMY